MFVGVTVGRLKSTIVESTVRKREETSQVCPLALLLSPTAHILKQNRLPNKRRYIATGEKLPLIFWLNHNPRLSASN